MYDVILNPPKIAHFEEFYIEKLCLGELLNFSHVWSACLDKDITMTQQSITRTNTQHLMAWSSHSWLLHIFASVIFHKTPYFFSLFLKTKCMRPVGVPYTTFCHSVVTYWVITFYCQTQLVLFSCYLTCKILPTRQKNGLTSNIRQALVSSLLGLCSDCNNSFVFLY